MSRGGAHHRRERGVAGGGGEAVKQKMKKCGKVQKKCGKMRKNAAKKSDDPKRTTYCIACGFSATQLPSDQDLGPRPQTHSALALALAKSGGETKRGG